MSSFIDASTASAAPPSSSSSSSSSSTTSAAPLPTGFGSFQSPSVEYLIHQSIDDYVAPILPSFASQFNLPSGFSMKESSSSSTSSASSIACSSSSSAAIPLPPFGRHLLSPLFYIDPSWTFINHGAFGSVMRPLMSIRNSWSEYCESQPLRFIDRELLPLMVATIRRMAKFVDCDPTSLTLHTNATTALNIIFGSLDLAKGDVLYRLNLTYGAVKKMTDALIASHGIEIVESVVPLPLRSRSILLSLISSSLDAIPRGRVKLAVFDHISSNSGICLPIADIISLCHARGIPVLIDGAHSLGSIPLSLSTLGADYFVSNGHKWLCAPKGCAVMYVAPQHQSRIKPIVISHGTGSGYCSDFIWTGCRDYATLLTLGSAAELWTDHIGVNRAADYTHRLVMQAGRYLAKRWCTELIVGGGDTNDGDDNDSIEVDALTANMICVRLPGPLTPGDDKHNILQNRLHYEHNIEVPIKVLGAPTRLWMRISAGMYNDMKDYERVGEVMMQMRGERNDE